MKNLVKISFLAMYLVGVLPAFVFAQTTYPATMYFSPSSGSVTVNANFTVDVIVKTNGSEKTSGADMVIKFDSTKVQYISAARPTTNNFYSSQDVYENKDNASIGANSSVDIGHSVVPGTPAADYPTGTGNAATLTFKTLAPVGSTVALTLGFTGLGATTDSNVISSTGSDLLGSVTGATFTIASAPPTGALDHINLTPASATVAPNGTQSFTAVAKDAGGNSISGATYAWTVSANGTVSPASGASTTFTAGASNGSATVTVTATAGSVTKTASATVTIGSFTPGPGPISGPFITSISPSSGQKDATPQVTIYGGNFGTFDGTKNKVYFGMAEGTVLDWSNDRIVVRVPAASDITARLTVTVRALTSDDKTAEYLGYTYTMNLPDNGPETYTWIGLLLSAFGMAGLTYLKLFGKTKATDTSLAD